MRDWPRDREKQVSTDRTDLVVELMGLAGGLDMGQVATGIRIRPSFLTQVTHG